MTKVVILGAGGNGLEIVEIINDIRMNGSLNIRCVGILDDDKTKWGQEYLGIKINGPIAKAQDMHGVKFISALHSPRKPGLGEIVLAKNRLRDRNFQTLIHPSAFVSKSAKIGEGTVIFPNCFVGANSIVGDHVMILGNSTVGHESRIGSYCTISGNVFIASRVLVDKGAYLGAGSNIREGANIGKNVTVGMGAVVVKNFSDNLTIAGNPARKLNK